MPLNSTGVVEVLQQRWVIAGTMWGAMDETNSEWRDVPLVEEK